MTLLFVFIDLTASFHMMNSARKRQRGVGFSDILGLDQADRVEHILNGSNINDSCLLCYILSNIEAAFEAFSLLTSS